MKYKQIIFLLVLISTLYLEFNFAINITNCSELQNITDLNMDYFIVNEINCNNTSNFIPIGNQTHPFRGTLDGKSNMIKNIKITSTSSDMVGIFAYGDSATIKNLTIVNVNITTSHSGVGALFGYLINSTLTDIYLNTTSSGESNVLSGTSNMNCSGLVGYSINVQFTNIFIQNTLLSFPDCTAVGSITGYSINSILLNCHNIGFPSIPGAKTVVGKIEVGGLVGNFQSDNGYPLNSQIKKSGVVSGTIQGQSTMGGISGELFIEKNAQFSECYVKKEVIINCLNSDAGGIFGYISFGGNVNLTVEDSYSKANMTGSGI